MPSGGANSDHQKGPSQVDETTANTLVRWVNENAFAPIVRARPCPTFGRPVHRRGSPHRLRPGTSPHNGVMIDLGNLGGTLSMAQCANNRGEVIGSSNLPGNQVSHAFLWRNGRIQDLGTLGGPLSDAIWINDAGDIAGSADIPTPDIHYAVRWHDGRIQNLGTLPGDACSRGRGINSRGQVVGGTSDCHSFLHAFVWDEGIGMLDLNTLIAPGSGLQITSAFNINDRGEILARSFPIGTTPNDDEDLGHLVLLMPCDDDSPCENSISPTAVQAVSPVTHSPRSASNSNSVPNTWQSYRSIVTGKAFPEK